MISPVNVKMDLQVCNTISCLVFTTCVCMVFTLIHVQSLQSNVARMKYFRVRHEMEIKHCKSKIGLNGLDNRQRTENVLFSLKSLMLYCLRVNEITDFIINKM